MKNILAISIVLFSSLSFAEVQPQAQSEAKLYNTARSYEVVLEGDVAKKLYDVLDTSTRAVNSSDGGWINKNAKGIDCGQNQKTRKYFCTVNVDENGVQ